MYSAEQHTHVHTHFYLPDEAMTNTAHASPRECEKVAPVALATGAFLNKTLQTSFL